MITHRPASERGHANHGWLDTQHTFSFGRYYDPAHISFRSLRVLNDDRIAPGGGFGTHPHDNMEILTWVLDGAVAHRDSMGNGSTLLPGEMQRMTAGTGILHSEFNPSETDPLRLLQVWIIPEAQGLEPSYEQKAFPVADRPGQLHLLASHDARDGSVKVHQDVSVFAGRLRAGDEVTHTLAPGRHAWLQVARGSLVLDGNEPLELHEGDGVAISDETLLRLRGIEGGDSDEPSAAGAAEVLLFDLA